MCGLLMDKAEIRQLCENDHVHFLRLAGMSAQKLFDIFELSNAKKDEFCICNFYSIPFMLPFVLLIS